MIAKEQQKSEYLKEALRLAELRLEEQNITLTLQEKKAVLIATLSIAFISYFLAFTGEIGDIFKIMDWDTEIKLVNLVVFKILPSCLFVASMIYSINALDLTKLGTGGASPDYTLDDYFNRDLYELRNGLLEDYNERVEKNEKLLEDKDKQLRKARNWLFRGIELAVILVAFRETLKIFFAT